MEENPYKAPATVGQKRSPKYRAEFIFFAAIAVFFGVQGIFTGLLCLWAVVMGLTGGDTGPDVTPFHLAVMTAIPTAICLGIGAIAWWVARGFRE